jgi:hypothetical protein
MFVRIYNRGKRTVRALRIVFFFIRIASNDISIFYKLKEAKFIDFKSSKYKQEGTEIRHCSPIYLQSFIIL